MFGKHRGVANLAQDMDKVKALATHILTTTITEKDKYQVGLTKIFFRAGMLAQFEQRRTDRLNAVTTVIQKNLRRYVHQKKYQSMRTNAVKIQSWNRKPLSIAGLVSALESSARFLRARL